MAKQTETGEEQSRTDEVTEYLESVLRGIVKASGVVSVIKMENPARESVVYMYKVPDGDDSNFVRDVTVNLALQMIAGRAAGKHFPGKYRGG